jgi:hypothetical protein
MSATAGIRWELVRCVDCGHQRPRQHSMFRGMNGCPHCFGALEVLPMVVLERQQEGDFSLADAADALLSVADRERAGASQDLDVVRRARREGRAEAFAHALEILASAASAKIDDAGALCAQADRLVERSREQRASRRGRA